MLITIILTAIFISAFIFDLFYGVSSQKQHRVSWIKFGAFFMSAMIFGGCVMAFKGIEHGEAFYTAYFVELMLSVDNIMIFNLIFNQFNIGEKSRTKLLTYGILFAFVARGLFIYAGNIVIQKFEIAIPIFALILLYSGISSLFTKHKVYELKDMKVMKMVNKLVRIDYEYSGNKFWITRNGVIFFTPLFVALLVIEFTDIIFAVDSVPAIFGISKDPLIVYSSNMFAVIGLRSIYIILDKTIKDLHYFDTLVSLMIIFIGAKMIVNHFFHNLISESVFISAIATMIGITVLLNVIEIKKSKKA
jgi:tellurite resistance protein TerC